LIIEENVVSLKTILDNIEKSEYSQRCIFYYQFGRKTESFSCDSGNLVIVFDGSWDNCVCSALLMFDLY